MHATFANTHKNYYVTSYQEKNHAPSDPGHETTDSQFFLSFEDYKKVNINFGEKEKKVQSVSKRVKASFDRK